MTKKKKKKVSEKPRHVDSVVRDDDDEDALVVTSKRVEEDGNRETAMTVATKESSVPMVSNPAEVSKTARDLILQAKTALSKRTETTYGPSSVSLTLESDLELDAAMLLEHQGRGRLFKGNEGEWVFEFNEETGAAGGILKGDILQNKD